MVILVILASCGDADPRPKRQTAPNPPSIGFIDSPSPSASVGPVFTVAGWAADESGVDRVRIYLDDELVAIVPVTSPRPDVDRAYRKYAGTGPHGFHALIDAGTRAGSCVVRAEALDKRGAITTIFSVPVTIEP